MSGSKSHFKLFALILLFIAAGCRRNAANSSSLLSDAYVMYADDTGSGGKWAEYLYRHLLKRCEEDDVVFLDGDGKRNENDGSTYHKIRVIVNDSLGYDYCIENDPGELVLKARDDKTMLWLIYQYIALLGVDDERFRADDIPPATITLESCCRNFDFEYREPFFAPNLSEDYSGIIGTHSLETDWGIWGHNLGKILNESGETAVYARQGGRIREEQYCFSNDATFSHIREYIIDNYGHEPMMRFAVMPNDNTIVCTCGKCSALGNTVHNATPAVSFMIDRLAGEFPSHMFFTSGYLTTREIPSKKMPDNAGVLISTIELPKGIALYGIKEAEKFTREVYLWKNVTPNIYIWDYAANFDDYITPLPVLYGLQKQLRFFKSIGVRGIFLNASGYDYSPFDDLKTFVAAALMIDHTLSVESLCRVYFNHFYPVSGSNLADYYLLLEKSLESNGKPYNMYGSFRESLRTFLDADDFMAFYNSLEPLVTASAGLEKMKLEKLLTAMGYTRLQLAYTQGTGSYGFASLDGKRISLMPATLKAYDGLSNHVRYSDFSVYKETEGSIEDYIRNWESLLQRMPYENYLIGEPVEILSHADEEYLQDSYMINDGVTGFYGDYHQGWLLNSSDFMEVRFPAENVRNTNVISMRFLMHTKHRIYLPEKIEILKDGTLYKTATPANTHPDMSGITVARTDIEVDISDAEFITLKIYKRPDSQETSIACDEIQLKHN